MPSRKKPEPATPPATTRYVCVHGHFYQPPRENPWLETVEVQDSAAPYHDWNERITSECYAPNGASRITNQRGEITRIVNNYSRMSFNFGPTLLSWLEDFAPRTYRMIQDADVASAARYSGHGSAMAQVYNHIIMPLASERDARTQIRWGIVDFQHRFGRKPEGMWLAETAVSRAVLDLLAQEGIKFTVLAPAQCARVRRLALGRSSDDRVAQGFSLGSHNPPKKNEGALAPEGTGPWSETPNATVDPTQPYLVRLPEGRSIAVFFYDGPASRAIAFEGLLNSGVDFGNRLLAGLNTGASTRAPDEPCLSHVATDGESYGHHHKHGEMALSYAMHWIDQSATANLTNYAEFLANFPPTWQAEVVDNSSWSCIHGVERWRSNCGCNGGHAGWNQRWRGPLRHALDLLRDRTAPLAEAIAAPLLKDLWAARDAYIHIVLDRSSDNLDRFFSAHATRTLTSAERITVLSLLELQRHTQLMYTSCGWFFDEISGIETVQIIAYAGRVLQLANDLFTEASLSSATTPGAPPLASEMWVSASTLESDFLALLATAESNVPDIGNGAEVYRRFVTGSRLSLEHVGAHYAISSMFRSYPDFGQLFCFDITRQSYDLLTSGRGRIALGRASLKSRITEETEDICFAVLHLGDQNLSAAVKRFSAETSGAPFMAPTSLGPSDTQVPQGFTFGSHSAQQVPQGFSLGSHSAQQVPQGFSLGSHSAQKVEGALAPEGQPAMDPATWDTFTADARTAIRRADLPALVRLIDSNFGGTVYSLASLFSDEQHRILQTILNQTLSEVEGSLMRIYEEHASLLDFIAEANVPAPPALAVTAGFAINASLRHALDADTFDAAGIARLLRRSEIDHVRLDTQLLAFTADKRMKRAMVRLESAAETHSTSSNNGGSQSAAHIHLAVLNDTLAIAESLRTLPFEVNLWQAQNIWNDMLQRSDRAYWSREWREGFRKIGLALNICVDDLVIEQGVRAF